MLGLKAILGAVVSPIAKIITKRQDRKLAENTAKAKLTQATHDDTARVMFSDQEWEAISTKMQGSTWKDEYATVSILSIINIVVLGGILSAFGHPAMLEGVVLAIQTLDAVGVRVGFLMEAIVLAAVGLSVWSRF